MARSLEQLQEQIEYQFKRDDLLRVALTHSSTGEEHNYERLEFLGDRVLGLVISELLFQKFPKEFEGDLAKRLAALVQGSTLSKLAAGMNLGDYISFSEAERLAGGAANENILADVFEALIGALYLDGGLAPCRKLIEHLWSDVFFTMKTPPQHPKTALQEWAQSLGLPLPTYEIADQSGPDHAPVFEIKLTVKDYGAVTGKGRTRQEAEKEAARLFLEKHHEQK